MQSQCPPPKRFIAAVGVESVKLLSKQPPFIRRGRSAGRFAVGIKYELEVHAYLELWALGRTETELRLGQWIEFTDKSGRRWCQVDAVWINRERKTCLVCEVKYQHTSDAWWQLKWLYLPVLQVAFPGYRFGLLEIVHWFDPATLFPEPTRLISRLEDAPYDNLVSTLVLNPRRRSRLPAPGRPSGPSDRAEADRERLAEGAELVIDIE